MTIKILLKYTMESSLLLEQKRNILGTLTLTSYLLFGTYLESENYDRDSTDF